MQTLIRLQSDLGLHCLSRPVCPKTLGLLRYYFVKKYVIVLLDFVYRLARDFVYSSPEPKAHKVSLQYTNGQSYVVRRPHFQT